MTTGSDEVPRGGLKRQADSELHLACRRDGGPDLAEGCKGGFPIGRPSECNQRRRPEVRSVEEVEDLEPEFEAGTRSKALHGKIAAYRQIHRTEIRSDEFVAPDIAKGSGRRQHE